MSLPLLGAVGGARRTGSVGAGRRGTTARIACHVAARTSGTRPRIAISPGVPHSTTRVPFPAARLSLPASRIAPRNRTTSTDVRSSEPFDDKIRDACGNLDRCVRFANIDATDVRACETGLASNRAHDVGRARSIARTNVHEQTSHASWLTLSCRTRDGDRRARAFSALFFEKLKRGGSDLDSVEIIEQRFKREKLSAELSRSKRRTKLVAHLRVAGTSLRARLSERNGFERSASRQRLEASDLSRLNEGDCPLRRTRRFTKLLAGCREIEQDDSIGSWRRGEPSANRAGFPRIPESAEQFGHFNSTGSVADEHERG
jgi:hypothetical protein